MAPKKRFKPPEPKAETPQVRRLVRQPRGFAQGHARGAAGHGDAAGRGHLGLGTEKSLKVAFQSEGNHGKNHGENDGKIIGE